MTRFSVYVAPIVALGMLLSAPAASAAGWSIQAVPVPAGFNGGQLTSVSCSSSTACTAVGSYAESGSGFGTTAFAERWDGSGWSVQTLDSPGDVELSSVSCPDASDCVAVGYQSGGSALSPPVSEVWNGSAWTMLDVPAPGPANALNMFLDSVSCSSATACTAVGTYETSGGASVTFLAERYDGTSWSQQTFPAPASQITGNVGAPKVSCPTATACVVTGGYAAQTSSAGFSEAWNGTSWSVTGTGLPLPLYGLSCTAANACTTVGEASSSQPPITEAPVAVGYDGTTWSPETVPGPASGYFGGVSCASATACTAVGSANLVNNIWDDTLAEYWNGATWSVQSTVDPPNETNPILAAVSCSSATSCMAVGTAQLASSGSQLLSEQYAPATALSTVVSYPSISGQPFVGHTLTETHGTWTQGATSYTYEWKRCNAAVVCTTVSTAPSYTLTPYDLNNAIIVLETSHNDVGASTPASSDETAFVADSSPQPPTNLSSPSISGQPIVGQTLTESHGTWTRNPINYTYEWKDCSTSTGTLVCRTVSRAQSYHVTSVDLGDTILVLETASNAAGPSIPESSVATATVSAPGAPLPPASTKRPSIAGSAVVGHTLREVHGRWRRHGSRYTYRWFVCRHGGEACTPIAGATHRTYRLSVPITGDEIRVREIAYNKVGASRAATSAPTPHIARPAA